MVKALKKTGFTSIRYFLAFIFLILAWEVFSAVLRLAFLPSPAAVFVNIVAHFTDSIAIHALFSLWRIFAGVLLSAVSGVAIGLCMGYFHAWDRVLSPVVYFLYPIPKIALLPLVMLFLGLGEVSKIFIIFLIVIFQVIVSARDAAKSIPVETYYSLYSLGAGRIDIFKRIILKASLPGLLTSLRISLGTALSVLFFTETFGTQYGMGYYIMDAWTRVNYIDMFSGIVVLSLIGFLLFLLVDVLEKFLCPWKLP